MRKLQVSLSWLDIHYVIGELHIYESRGQERYQFTYNQTWLQAKAGFAIDPALPLVTDARYVNHRLWGVFQDISPDRWGVWSKPERIVGIWVQAILCWVSVITCGWVHYVSIK